MLNFGIRSQENDKSILTPAELGSLPYSVIFTTSVTDWTTEPDIRTDLQAVLSQPGTTVSEIFGYVSLVGIFENSDPFLGIPLSDRYFHQVGSPNVWRADYWEESVQQVISDEFGRVIAAGATGIFLDEVDIYYSLGSVASRLNLDLGGTQEIDPLVNSALITMNSVIAIADANPGVEIIANVDPFMLSGVLRNPSLITYDHEDAIDAFADRVGGVLIENYLHRQSSLSTAGAADMLTGMHAWADEGITVYVSADFDVSGTLTTGPFAFSVERVLNFYTDMAMRGFVPSANAFDGASQEHSVHDRFDPTIPVFNASTIAADVLALYGFQDGRLSGLSGNDTLIGRHGNDVLDGGNGTDTVYGGTSDDTVYGGSHNDLIHGDEGGDSLLGEGSSDTIHGGAGEDGIDGGGSADVLFGDAGADSILGGSNADRIEGGTERDTIRGGTSDDTAYGGSHEDRLYGDSGDDSLYGDGSSDTLYGGDGEDLVEGGGSADRLYGGANSDTLIGGSNNDTLYGGASSDTVTGGTGKDVFVFSTGIGSSVDAITDFSVPDDTIWLEDHVFDGLSAGALAAAAFVANTSGQAGMASHRLIYESDTGALFFDADGSGAGARVQFATLSIGLALTEADFLVV